MTPKLPITRERIRHHLHYDWWQYVLLIALSIFGWNLLFTTTHYRSPENLKMEWYYEGPMTIHTQELASSLLEEAKTVLFPDVEETTFSVVGTDENYGPMQIMVWMSAAQGDLYMLTRDSFNRYGADGAMVDLQPYVDSGALNVDGVDLTRGYLPDSETGEFTLCGIPADHLKGLEAYEIFPEGTMLSALSTGGNIDNTICLMNWLLTEMK